MSTSNDLPQIRQKAQDIMNRATNDPTFRQQAQADPAGILKEYGLSEQDVQGLANERFASLADQQGCTVSCTDFTCITSECPESCFISIVMSPPV